MFTKLACTALGPDGEPAACQLTRPRAGRRHRQIHTLTDKSGYSRIGITSR